MQWVTKDLFINIFSAHNTKFQYLSRRSLLSGCSILSTHCYGLNGILPKFICLSSKSRCDGIWRCAFGRQLALDEVMRVGPS